MELAKIFRTLLDSDPAAWQRVRLDCGRDVAFLRADVHLRIESLIEEGDYQQPWATNFPSRTSVGYSYNLYYASTLLHRFLLVAVDGGRALLPSPRVGTTVVPELTFRVAQIFDSGRLEEYIAVAGLEVERDSTVRT